MSSRTFSYSNFYFLLTLRFFVALIELNLLQGTTLNTLTQMNWSLIQSKMMLDLFHFCCQQDLNYQAANLSKIVSGFGTISSWHFQIWFSMSWYNACWRMFFELNWPQFENKFEIKFQQRSYKLNSLSHENGGIPKTIVT